ncbi:MAG: GNAT family N-acetyltransferase [Chloroflexi bacterium]|nr:GNAT family N-acetyltransferase [Chloroflexota bacterium]
MKIDIYTTLDVFETLAGEWNELLRRSATNVLFLTREWQKTWWQALGDGELRVLTMRDESGTLVGIAPMFFSAGDAVDPEVAFVGCKEVSDYLDFIFARGHERACYQALADYLGSDVCPVWHHMALCNVPEYSPTLSMWVEQAQACDWQTETHFEDVSPIIALPDTFEVYLATLEGKERRELQRKLRRAGSEVAVTYTQDAGAVDADMDDFLQLMTASMPSKAVFMTPRMASFFHAIARSMFDAGWLQLAFLEVRGERAATYMNFVYDDMVLVYNSGLDPLKFAHLSPGQVLLGRLIEQAIRDKRHAFDFLQGNEDYKYKLGGKDLKLYTLYVAKH